MTRAALPGSTAAAGAPVPSLTVERQPHPCDRERWLDHWYADRAVWKCICGASWETAA